jgi:hypothetical protein
MTAQAAPWVPTLADLEAPNEQRRSGETTSIRVTSTTGAVPPGLSEFARANSGRNGFVVLRASERPANRLSRRCVQYFARDAVEDDPELVALPMESDDPALRDAVAAVLTEAVYDATRRARMQLMGPLKPPRPSERARDLLRRWRDARPT